MQLLEHGHISVLSLDVFDTLVWRIVPVPVDAFTLLGHRLTTLGHLDPGTSPAVFARLRQRAEQVARSWVGPPTGPQEVGLDQIYAQMPQHVFSGISPAAVVDLEADFEREITFPDLEILQLARLAREKFGVRTVLVSDTYFSEKQIRRIVDRDIFAGLDIHAVFTSSDHQIGKGLGLFAKVVEELGHPPDELLHVGDNEEADVAAAAAAGIHTVHFERFAKETASVLEEEGVLPRLGGRRRTSLDGRSGDFGLTAVRSKALARPEVEALGLECQPFWRFGTAVLGPVCAGFAEWVHAEGRARGHKTVHCLMREGEFLGRLVQGAGLYVDDPLEARRFWASRQVTARAAIFEASRAELQGFLQRRRAPTVRQFLEGLGLGISSFPDLFQDADSRLDDHELWERLLGMIEARSDVVGAIVDSAARLRRRLLAYFHREVPDQDRMLVADLGWGATIQANLQRVFDGSGLGVHVEGLYLATNDAALDRVLRGVEARGYLANLGVPAPATSLLSRSPEIIEQAFMHDVGSLSDYSRDGEPRCAEVRQDPVQVLQRVAVQSGVLAFQQEWARYRPLIPKTANLLAEQAREQLLVTLMRFIVRPSHHEATMFSSWLHDDNFGSEGAETVVSTEPWTWLRYMTPEQYLALPSTKVFWPFGLAAIYEPALAATVGAVAEEVLPPEVFVQSEQHFTPLYLDDGSGFAEKVRVPTRINGAGLCFVRAVLDDRAIHRVRLAFPGGPGIVRMDRLAFSFTVKGRAEPIVVVIEDAADFAELDHEHADTLALNVLVGHRQAPQVIYRCSPEWRDRAYRVEVEAAFAWLPVAPLDDPPPLSSVRHLSKRAARALLVRARSALVP